METKILKITGMSCDHCIKTVENELHEAGFENVTVKIGSAKVEFDGSAEKKNIIESIIEDSGYKVVE